MYKSPKGIQVHFSVTIPEIAPQELHFDPNPKSGSDRTLLGRGGFGVVYAGHYEGQAVAIKTLHITTAKVVKALHEEAALMFRIASPHTVKLLGICSAAKETSLVMENMAGGSLFHVLQDESQALPWPLRYRIAYEIAEGLWALHQQGIVHRDLKSLNVLLDGEQHAKVTDFGFSKLRGQITSVAASSKNSLGTPAYKAPELVAQDLADSDSDEEEAGAAAAKNPNPYSPSSDVYAYGVVLWELATRQIPFAGQEPIKVYKKIAKGKHEKIPADCPAAFAALIKACWAMQPGQRPRTDQVVAQTKAWYEATQAAPTLADEEKEVKEESTPASWQMDREILRQAAGAVQGYALLPVGDEDITKVIKAYQHAPVKGKSVGRVHVIYNPQLNRAFAGGLELLEARFDNPAFSPAWQREGGTSGKWRKKTAAVLSKMAAPYMDPKYPHVTILPMWHATSVEVLPSLFSTGFANLAVIDSGFFGKGIYSAGEARYSYGVYGRFHSNPVLLMNWVATYSPYPVIHGDMDHLQGKGNYANHDTHFIPVRPRDSSNPFEDTFHPCKANQPYTYTELVVFNPTHCLARYIVELQSDDPQATPTSLLDLTAFRTVQANVKATQQAEKEAKRLAQRKVLEDEKQAAIKQALDQAEKIAKIQAQVQAKEHLKQIQKEQDKAKAEQGKQQQVIEEQAKIHAEQMNKQKAETKAQAEAQRALEVAQKQQAAAAAKQAAQLKALEDEKQAAIQKAVEEAIQQQARKQQQVIEEQEKIHAQQLQKLTREREVAEKAKADAEKKAKTAAKERVQPKERHREAEQELIRKRKLNEESAEEREHAAFELERERKKAVKKKPRLSPSQDQDALVTACEEGNAAEVRRLLNKGAGANTLNSKGIHPLGAAVWGMNPEVVDTLLGEMKEESSLTWEECEAHNIGHYKEVFMFNEFAPQTFKDWNELLLKMNGSPFLARLHLAEARKVWNEWGHTSSWRKFCSWMSKDCDKPYYNTTTVTPASATAIRCTGEELNRLRITLRDAVSLQASVRAYPRA